jgi:hypothetical protein
MFFHNPTLTLPELRFIQNRQAVEQKYATERRKLIKDCVAAIINGKGCEP